MTEDASIYSELKIIYSINDVGKIGQIHARNIKLDHILTQQQEENQRGLKT